MLNKFPIINNHFILATTSYRSQADLLEKEDLSATYACLKAWETRKESSGGDDIQKRLFAFFNSGQESGASQPHRHVQFLPVENMLQSGNNDTGGNWAPLIDTEQISSAPVGSPTRLNLPFACYAANLPEAPSAEFLHDLYLSLYILAVKDAHHPGETPLSTSPKGDPAEEESFNRASISYNLALTTSRMIICPRRCEAAWIPLDPSLKNDAVPELGSVKLNGTILAGTLMVKEEAEWDKLRNEPALLDMLLNTVGFSSLPAARV